MTEITDHRAAAASGKRWGVGNALNNAIQGRGFQGN